MITALQLLLSLSILVVLHELGHFTAAKWFKTRVEKFYLFFNPGFELFKKQIGETEYGIGWLPLGGYVKISGMIDESFDTEQMKQEPKPWEFRSKPAWQRLIIMVGGVFVNFVLGIVLFSMILFVWGESYIVPSSLKNGVAVTELGGKLGLRDGDDIISVGQRDFDKFSGGIIIRELVINQGRTIKVSRNGSEQLIQVPEEVIPELTKHKNSKDNLIVPRYPYEIGTIDEGSPGEKGGLQIGDHIIAVNGEPTPFAHNVVRGLDAVEAEEIGLTVMRNGSTQDYSIVRSEGKIGIRTYGLEKYVDTAYNKYSFSECIPAGWNKSWRFLGDQIKAFGHMFRGNIKASDGLGSFITIGKMFGDTWDWQRFWTMTATLSLLLAFINLLPIPALDGGYVMFLIYETISGRKVPDKVMEVATFAGFVLLMMIMVFALGNDIIKNFF